MTLFVDASALVAILGGEADRLSLTESIRREDELLWSPVSKWETVAGLCHGHEIDLAAAGTRVSHFASDNGFRMVAIGEPETAIALDAYARYGKGRHPARLNMGDCFAYACAKANDARLLYKGDDFARTDMA